MEINIQEIIELEDCSEFAVKKRNEQVKRALFRYANGKPKLNPEEKEILITAMESYKSQAKEGDAAKYNALLYRNFASRPLKEGQIAKLLHINKRTVYKLLDAGINDLSNILYGVGGLELLPKERSQAFIKEKIQETITEQLTEELEGEIKNDLTSFFKEYQPNIIETEDNSSLEREVTQQRVRETLRQIKKGEAPTEEREKLMEAMDKYKATAVNEKQEMIYNILFLFYLAATPLKANQLSNRYRINKRTVYKYITKGVENLADILHGVK